MTEDFVTYEQAQILKELGFDWECSNNTVKYVGVETPSLAQTQKWLRDVKDIIIGIDFDNWNDKYECHVYKRMGYKGELIRDTYGSQLVTNEYHEDFDTYEQALSSGIDKALEFLKQ